MAELLEDLNNLKIVESLVSGESVNINLSGLSKNLGKHRSTLQKRIENLFERNIIEPPFFPFHGLHQVFPLLTILNIDIPECVEVP